MFRRTLAASLTHHLERGKSILLLGPRQTGKTTLLQATQADLVIELISPRERQRFERDPSLLSDTVLALGSKRPLVIIDEIQKVPPLMDVAQELIDKQRAQFILTGSSARKLRRHSEVNLLPGRVVSLRLDPLTLEEDPSASLNQLLFEGSLPGIRTAGNGTDRESDLRSYVESYLEEEIRQEALVKKIAPFSRFLECAALESGRIVNASAIASEIGVSAPTVQGYLDILVDCLVAERIEPITKSTSRKRLTKSCRYLLFDLGVRRLAAAEGTQLGPPRMGELFEQMIGLELLRMLRLHIPGAKLRFWRDPGGPEVDWVVEHHGRLTPIEVKWSERPTASDARHLEVFLDEYGGNKAFILCRAPQALAISARTTALPWATLGNPESEVFRTIAGERMYRPR
jgi:uncharacterized protein